MDAFSGLEDVMKFIFWIVVILAMCAGALLMLFGSYIL